MTNEARIRVGVLGATGYIGQPYRDEMRAVADVKIVALCARRRDLLEAAGNEDDAAMITDRWQDVVHHPDVNFVVVATPDALHHEAVLECAAAHKHLLCEKPLARNATEAEEMYSAYQSQPLANFVPFWTRYAEVIQCAKRVVRSGRLGEIRGAIFRWHNPRPSDMPLTWRDDANLSGGGSIADVGSHAYDTVRWLLDDTATRVLVHADTITPAKADLGDINLDEALRWGAARTPTKRDDVAKRKATTPDYANIAWEFSRGAVGTLVVSHASYFRRGLCPELELHGTDASLAVNRMTGEVLIAEPDQSPQVWETFSDQGFGNRFERFVFPVVRSIMEGNSPAEHPNLFDGWRVQCFIDAALQSAATGDWVQLADT